MFQLQFQFNIFLNQIVIYRLQMKITSYAIGPFVYHTYQLIGRGKEGTPLITVEAEQHDEAYPLQQDEEEPIIILQEEIQ